MDIADSIHRAVAYMHSMYAEPLTVTDIAAEVYMSPSYFAGVFRAVTGFTVRNYIIRYRLFRAANDLLQTENPIVVIAFTHGFSSQQAFTKSFAAVYGTAPAQFRRSRLSASPEPFPPENIWKEHILTMELRECFENVRFISKAPFFVAGVEADIDYGAPNGPTPIKRVWDIWNAGHLLGSIPDQAQPGVTYGITHSETEDDKGKYIVCAEVKMLDNLPVGLVGRRFEACEYAVFETTLRILWTGAFWKSFYTSWLPLSGYRQPDEPLHESYATFAKYPAIEVYDRDFKDEDSMIRIYAPIVK